MNILFYCQNFWPESFIINNLAKSLSLNNPVEVLTGKPNYPKGKVYSGYKALGLQTEQFNLISINRIPIVPRGKSKLGLALNYLSFVVSGILFAPWSMRYKKVDVIFVFAMSPLLQAIPAIFLAKIKRAPIVVWVQDLWPESLSATGYVKNKSVLKVVEYIVKYIYSQTDLILVQSKAFVQPVSLLAGNTPIKYYANSVDDSFFKVSDTASPLLKEFSNKFTVLFAGNIGAAQAIDVIVNAAETLKNYTDIQFIVIGDGSKMPWLAQELIQRDLSNIHLLGQQPVEMMPSTLQQASVLLVTLANQAIFSYTIPSKVQAYLASGRPILACLNGEGAKIVEEARAGIAIKAENAGMLAEAVLQLYKMPADKLTAMGANGREYCRQHFAHDKLVDELTTHLQSVLRIK